MFNLVKYRLLFLLISGLVIIPGFISLLIFQLNVGIDFTNGSELDLRPQIQMTDAQINDLLKPFKLESLQVVLGKGSNAQDGQKTIWIKLNTGVDSNVDSAIRSKLTGKFPSTSTLDIKSATLKDKNGKPYSLYTVTNFQNVPTKSAVQAALADLPAVGASNQAVPTPTPTPKSASTPTAKGSATATATSNNNQPTSIPVSVVSVEQGTTSQVIQILTRSTINPAATNNPQDLTVQKIQESILNHGGPNLAVVSSSQVGPEVAAQTTQNAALAVVAASAFILLYVWFSFRKVPKAFRYGACAIIALLHDVLVVLGVFSILGHFFGIQISALFITALLTVIGFSVHDTIVVFDRIRENMQRRTVETFEEVVNASLVQTMARSLNTSLTVLFTLFTLTLFTQGINADVHTFTLTLLIGIFSGTYSSIFNASMLLVVWDNGELGFKYLGGGHEPLTKRDIRERELIRAR
ncbi:MAG TPA: protein translocase subunit SecF [Ktedonobacteraceae bacterium]|nr:protein translocase subunit SecF [Ktedonobacteraceae bacterium]